MRDPDDNGLDALLRCAAPVQQNPADEEGIFSDAWSRVQASIDDDGTTAGDALQRRLNLIGDREVAARRRRRAARLASAALVVAVAGGGTAAAADFILTRTGEQLTGWEVNAGGSGEALNLGGTDRQQVFEEITADIPFPPGYEAQRDWALNFYPVENDSRITESHLRSSIAGDAVCTWADAWVAADNATDTAARAEATETLSEAVSWEPFLTFAKDHGESAPQDSAEDESYRWWLRPLAEAAQHGNRQAMLDLVGGGAGCSPNVVPVIAEDPGSTYYGPPR